MASDLGDRMLPVNLTVSVNPLLRFVRQTLLTIIPDVGAFMRTNTKYDDTNVLEDVILPMANLKYSLEAILNEEQRVSMDDLLRGLRLVHENASAILRQLNREEVPPIPELPERKTPGILREFATEWNACGLQLQSTTFRGATV